MQPKRTVVPRWQEIARLGDLKPVRSSFYWLLIVPPVVRVIETVDRLLTFKIFGQSITLQLRLPFSWKLFYLSAVCFALGAAVYLLRCPRIVRDHRSYDSFESQQKGMRHPQVYAEEIKSEMPPIKGDENYTPTVRDTFWRIHEIADSCRVVSRVSASAAFMVGFILITVVLAQNVLFVIQFILRT